VAGDREGEVREYQWGIWLDKKRWLIHPLDISAQILEINVWLWSSKIRAESMISWLRFNGATLSMEARPYITRKKRI
jgi:hypothetical protein